MNARLFMNKQFEKACSKMDKDREERERKRREILKSSNELPSKYTALRKASSSRDILKIRTE
jgi:hypothetical protein